MELLTKGVQARSTGKQEASDVAMSPDIGGGAVAMPIKLIKEEGESCGIEKRGVNVKMD